MELTYERLMPGISVGSVMGTVVVVGGAVVVLVGAVVVVLHDAVSGVLIFTLSDVKDPPGHVTTTKKESLSHIPIDTSSEMELLPFVRAV